MQQPIDFYGDHLLGALGADGEIYIPLSQMCESLGLDTVSQVRRIRRTQTLAASFIRMMVETPDGKRAMNCLRVDLVGLWLGGIETSRIRDERVQEKLIAYQTSLAKVAWAVFGPMRAAVMPASEVEAMALRMNEITERMESIDQTLATLKTTLSTLAESVEQMRAVQVIVNGLQSELNTLRAELADLQTRSANAFKIAGDRLKRLEIRLNPGSPITEEQAARIKEAVTYVANALQERGKQRPYAEVWAAFKQHFSLTEYKALPQARFAEALEWLNRWGTAVLAASKSVPPPANDKGQ